ncbi:MAG: hypothetical protein AAF497_01580 [Planctomycetota bacterium]
MQSINTLVITIVVFSVAVLGGIAIQQTGTNANDSTTLVSRSTASSLNANVDWPPRLGQAYPDLTLTDIYGRKVQLSRFRGRTLLIEPIGMACKACQAFAGGHHVGDFMGMKAQPGLKSFKEYVKVLGKGVNLNDSRIVSIQVLFFGPNSHRAPTLKEAQAWAQHYGSYSPETIVLFADQGMIRPETKSIIPGFQLVDRDFTLRCDAGNAPRQDVYRDLIPMIRQVIRN